MTQQLKPGFISDVNERLAKGAASYGDGAYKTRKPSSLLAELREEVLDIAAYAALTCERVDAMILASKALEMAAPAAPKPRISKELPRGKQLGRTPYVLGYAELILLLTRNPGAVVFEERGAAGKVLPHCVMPETGLGTAIDYPLDAAVLAERIVALYTNALAAAFDRGEVYHLPVKP